jgi:large subunit ribosomal protein L28
MSKVCEVCGKGTVAGKRVQHHSKGSKWRYKAPKTCRVFEPNVAKVKVLNEQGEISTIKVCMKCLKKVKQS